MIAHLYILSNKAYVLKYLKYNAMSFLWFTSLYLFCLLGYVDIGLIPKGARGIRVTEVAEAGNFLAVRSKDPEKYYLNGGFIIQWNGEYKVAGTIFQYDRTGDLENLSSRTHQ